VQLTSIRTGTGDTTDLTVDIAAVVDLWRSWMELGGSLGQAPPRLPGGRGHRRRHARASDRPVPLSLGRQPGRPGDPAHDRGAALRRRRANEHAWPGSWSSGWRCRPRRASTRASSPGPGPRPTRASSDRPTTSSRHPPRGPERAARCHRLHPSWAYPAATSACSYEVPGHRRQRYGRLARRTRHLTGEFCDDTD